MVLEVALRDHAIRLVLCAEEHEGGVADVEPVIEHEPERRGLLRDVAGPAPLDQSFESRGGPLVGLAVRLLDEFKHPDAASPLIVEGLALQLLGPCGREARRDPAVPRWLLRVREALAERCTAPWTLAGVSMAGWNALVALVLAVLSAIVVTGREITRGLEP